MNNHRDDGMRYPSIDKLVEKTKSKYRLVIGSAVRARQLKSENEILIEKPHNKKEIGIALEEIFEGKIKIVDLPEEDFLEEETLEEEEEA